MELSEGIGIENSKELLINELEYISEAMPFGDTWQNMFPAMSVLYQLFYMFSGKCDFDKNLNDFAVFCWYKGCWPDQMLWRIADKWLYMLRAANDAAIVWYEGIPQEHQTEESVAKWMDLTEETGRAAAEIFQDLTGFVHIKNEERV